MSFLKTVLRSLAATAAVAGIIKGVDTLTETYGVTARMDIASGEIKCTKGYFSSGARSGVQRVISDVGIAEGWIEIRKDSRIVFSDEIPATIHQRIRNIIQNA
jgi:hypothetical protein